MTTLKLTAIFTPEEGGYVVHCPELDVTTEGDTFDEALIFLQDAVTSYIEIVGIEQVLREVPHIVEAGSDLSPPFFGDFDVRMKVAVAA